jgi:hypothetical protein
MHHLFPTITSVQSKTGRGVVYKMRGSNLSSTRAGCKPISSELIIPPFLFPCHLSQFLLPFFQSGVSSPYHPPKPSFLYRNIERGEKRKRKKWERKTKLENLINVKIAM